LSEHILITGGAGFIGRAVVREVLSRGHRVRVLDSMIEQVHGDRERPEDLPDEAELIRGDVRNGDVVAKALQGVDSVIHLAAEVGVGQSMYEVERYTSVNDVGTAVLLEKLIAHPVRRVVTASSMSIYGEGLYRTPTATIVQEAIRAPRTDDSQSWDPLDAQGRPLRPMPTPEWKRPTSPPSTRSAICAGAPDPDHDRRLRHGRRVPAPVQRLRPGQALSNPYTGVLAIFASRLLNGSAR
jgi:dTDP-L-rhamnose 4-epimerase